MKKLKCCGCKSRFPADTMLSINGSNFHSYDCATTYAREKVNKLRVKQDKQDKQDHSAAKRKMKDEDRGFQTNKAQTIFNKFIRLRDEGQVCISCQKPPKKKNAGHYLSRGAHPELRFNEDNCHLQCEHCNSFKSGNQALYRVNLINKIGVDKVAWLEGPHEPNKYTIDDLKQIQVKYTKLTKEMEKDL